jgi:hypothetical protein
MSYITAKIKNGKSWGITHCELVLPASSLENMSAEEIGEQVLALLPYVTRSSLINTPDGVTASILLRKTQSPNLMGYL